VGVCRRAGCGERLGVVDARPGTPSLPLPWWSAARNVHRCHHAPVLSDLHTAPELCSDASLAPVPDFASVNALAPP